MVGIFHDHILYGMKLLNISFLFIRKYLHVNGDLKSTKSLANSERQSPKIGHYSTIFSKRFF